MNDTNGSKKRHVAHRRGIRFFRAIVLTSVLSQTEGGDSIHRIFKRLLQIYLYQYIINIVFYPTMIRYFIPTLTHLK